MILALVPAAGKSTRMGRPKLALPLHGATVLERVVLALRSGGAEHVLVVIGPHVPELAPLAEQSGAIPCLLDRETADMRETVQEGLLHAEQLLRPGPGDAWLLVPGDHPTLDPGVVRALLASRQTLPEASIFVPTFEGRRGHPVLIGWEHVPGMRALPTGQGLNVYLRGQAAVTREIPVEQKGILCDLDTPEDYARLLR
jgi:molybdenum cofactor cytidylyltransferase